MAAEAIDYDSSNIVAPLTDKEMKLVAKGGPESVQVVQAKIDKVNQKGRLERLHQAASTRVAEMSTNFKAAVADAKGHTVTVLIAGGVGAVGGFLLTRTLRDYFAVGSYVPDIVVPILGIVVGAFGSQIKDKAGIPGSSAGARSFGMGLGGGIALGALGNTITTRSGLFG